MAFLPAVIAVYTSAGVRVDQPNAQGNYQPIILKLGTRLSYSSADMMDGRTAVTIDGLAGTLAPDYTSDEYPAPSWAGTRPGHIVLSAPVMGSYNVGTDTLTITATVPVWTDTAIPPHAYSPDFVKVDTSKFTLVNSPAGTLTLSVRSDLTASATWSGHGITGTELVDEVVLGDGVTASVTSGAATLSAYSDWSGNGISGTVPVDSVIVGTGVSASVTAGVATLTASATAGTTVHGVTLRNLTSDSDGLLLVDEIVGDATFSAYDADAAEVLVVGGPDVLVNCQTDPTENGIYHAEYFTSVYRLVRSAERAIGEAVVVTNGLIFNGSQWWCREKSVTEERWESLTGPSWGVYMTVGASAGAAGWVEALRVAPPSYVTNANDWDVSARSIWAKDDGESNPFKFGRRGWSDTASYSCGTGVVSDIPVGLQFGDPWEGDATKRVKCEVDTGALKFSVYQDASTGYSSRYMLAVTGRVVTCERFEMPT